MKHWRHKVIEKVEIPKGWEWVKLKDVCIFFQGYGFPKNLQGMTAGEYPFFKVGDISKNVQAGNTYLEFCENYINEDILKKLKVKASPRNTIVFAKIGEALKLNRRALVKQPSIIDNNAIGLKADDNTCNDIFLFYFLKCLKLENYSRATTVPSVRKSDIETIEIPLPPLPEQHRIVAEIEKLFSSLDKGIESLKTAQQQLKVYRQAVLKWAFEGKLTNENVKDGELPEGWRWVKLGDVIANIEAGKSFKCDERPPKDDEIGIVKVSAVTWGSYNEMESKTCFSNDVINSKYLIKREDFLFSRANTLELVGACVIVHKTLKKLMLSDKILRFNFTENASKKYVLHYLRSHKGRNEIEQKSTKQTTNLASINLTILSNLPLVICSLPEQQSVVSEIESRLSVCDKLEESITYSLKHAEALRQSILKKAFEGKLVPQDPNDEPASVLLERIRAEKEKNMPEKISKTKKKKQ